MHPLTPPSLFWLFFGGLCYYLALPPVNFAPLALAVPVCWGFVIRRKTGVPTKSTAVYATAFLFWLASIWWIACPHPLTTLGLLALAAYLSLYWVLFFVSARVAVHRFRIPLLVAMPVCWIGCEYLRCRMLGGFSFCSLEHAFYLYPPLIQFASLGGGLLVGGIIMLVGAACATIFYVSGCWRKICYIVFILIPLLLFFPHSSIDRWITEEYAIYFGKGTPYSIVALQGNRQVRLTDTPKEAAETFQQFMDLTYQTISEKRQKGESLPDLIIFPETVCPIPVLVFEGTVTPADIDLTDAEATEWERWYRQFVQQIDTPVIFGMSTLVFKDNPEKPLRLNSALLVQPQRGDEPGKLYRYDKMHLVMFGEYVPFANYLPDDFILRTLCPEATSGDKPVAFPIGWTGQGSEEEECKPVMASVNICFESSVAHLIRHQVLTLRKQGHDPRVLINISNVGWFRFSQQIEQHLATQVFRAVENGMWFVTAANGGYSAVISRTGRISDIGKRRGAEPVFGVVWWWADEEQHPTLYQKYGDWYALPLAMAVLLLVGFSFWERKQAKEQAG